jgi:hypothetical protein
MGGFYCNGYTTTTQPVTFGTCKTLLADGSPCTPHDSCNISAFCEGLDLKLPNPTCKKHYSFGIGERYSYDVQCKSGWFETAQTDDAPSFGPKDGECVGSLPKCSDGYVFK